MPILLIKVRAGVNFVSNQHLLKYIFFFFLVVLLVVPKARTYITFPFAYSALCQTCTISSLALITLLYFLSPNGCLWQSWGPPLSSWLGVKVLSLYFKPRGISVSISAKIQRRGYETCFILDSEMWYPTHPVPSTISFICVLYHHSPEEKGGSFPSSLFLYRQPVLQKLVLILVCDPPQWKEIPLPPKCNKPELSRSPAVGNGNPLQYSRLENPRDREAWRGYSPWDCKESDTTGRLSTGIQFIRLWNY